MRWIIDFYRDNPITAAVVLALGLTLAITSVAFGAEGVELALAFALLVGLLVGVIVAVIQRRDT